MIDKKTLISYEMKHLSKEYRTNVQKMDELLHPDFFEIGASGQTYFKHDILKAIPLHTHQYEIKDFSFSWEGYSVSTSYKLIEDSLKITACESKWVKTKAGLKLIFFKHLNVDCRD